MQVGLELAEARLRLGLSLEDISRRTKISVERLSAIERGDRDQLPPLVYLNGFVRAYAAEVHLHADDVASRYLTEFEHASALASQSAAAAASVDPLNQFDAEADLGGPMRYAAQPDPEPVPESPRELDAEPLPVAQSPPAPQGAILRVTHDPLTLSRDPDRFDRDFRNPADNGFPPHSIFATTPRRRRYGATVAVLAIAVVAGVLLSANYERLRPQFDRIRSQIGAGLESMAGDREVTAPDRTAPLHEATPAARPSSDDTPTSTRVGSPAPPRPPRETARSIAAPEDAGRRATARSDRPLGRPATASEDASRDHARATPPARAIADRESGDRDSGTAAATAADDVSGWWTLTNRVESTSYGAYNNLNLGYRVRLAQQGDRISGAGQKWMENGKALPPRRRTPITIEGTRVGDRLELNFREQGARRESGGTFVMEVAADGTMYGTFISDAANSRGSSRARRMEPRE